MVTGYADLVALRQLGADWNTSRPLAELRRPVGLPLPEVDLEVPVTAADLDEGKPWPPPRGLDRAARMTAQRQASKGDYRKWLPEYRPDVSFNPIGGYIDDVRAVMMASHPAEDEELRRRRSIRRSVGAATTSMINHGRAVFIGDGTVAQCLDVRFAWPFDNGEGWAFVVPVVTDQSPDGEPDAADTWIWAATTEDTGIFGGFRRRLESASRMGTWGHFGETIAAYPAVPMMLAVADRPPVETGWGTPHTDELIPIAVAMARRESGADYALDRFEVPHGQVKWNDADAAFRVGTETGGDTNSLDPGVIRQQAPALIEHDITVLSDGRQTLEFVQADLNTEAALAYLERLDRRWSQQTGQMPMESGDSAAEESGVAFARKQVRLVARSRELHEAQYDALMVVAGEFDWPYVGTMLGAQTGTVDDPEPGLGDDPDG